jgi:hypothetical protein
LEELAEQNYFEAGWNFGGLSQGGLVVRAWFLGVGHGGV